MEEKTVDDIQNKNELMVKNADSKETEGKPHHAKKTVVSLTIASLMGVAIIITIVIVIIQNNINRKDWTLGVGMGDPVYMQSWNGCGSLSVGEMVKLIDERDGGSYVVGKQADDKCWMLENLSLDLANRQVQSKINSSTTNASDGTLAYLINGGGATSSQFAKESLADWSSSNKYDSYSRPLIYTALKDTTIDTTTYLSAGFNERVGIYYNYCAASAGSCCYEKEILSKELDNTNLEITEDICPKGWNLPTKNDFDTFLHLKSPNHQNVDYQHDTIVASKLHTAEVIGSCEYRFDYDEEDYYEKDIKKLHIDSGTTRYWSSTAEASTLVYALDIGLYNHAEIEKTSTDDGFTIRCVHK